LEGQSSFLTVGSERAGFGHREGGGNGLTVSPAP